MMARSLLRSAVGASTSRGTNSARRQKLGTMNTRIARRIRFKVLLILFFCCCCGWKFSTSCCAYVAVLPSSASFVRYNNHPSIVRSSGNSRGSHPLSSQRHSAATSYLVFNNSIYKNDAAITDSTATDDKKKNHEQQQQQHESDFCYSGRSSYNGRNNTTTTSTTSDVRMNEATTSGSNDDSSGGGVMSSVTHWADIMRQGWVDRDDDDATVATTNTTSSSSFSTAAVGGGVLMDSEVVLLTDADLAEIERYWDRLMPTVSYLGTVQVARVYKALCVAFRAHKGQQRKSGEPFIVHVRDHGGASAFGGGVRCCLLVRQRSGWVEFSLALPRPFGTFCKMFRNLTHRRLFLCFPAKMKARRSGTLTVWVENGQCYSNGWPVARYG
jgi:hypothetical protein